jgi:hypothetical protein
MEKECKKHGLTESVKRKDGHYRCKKCAVEAVQKRREKTKQMAVDYKGGKCVICDYNKCISALSFHHLDSEEKEFGIAHKGYCRAWEKVKEELDKCILVCNRCHTEIHEGLHENYKQ